jgi:hypothetical protein
MLTLIAFVAKVLFGEPILVNFERVIGIFAIIFRLFQDGLLTVFAKISYGLVKGVLKTK